MTGTASRPRLDDHVSAVVDAVGAAGVPTPDVLLFPATGAGSVAAGLHDGVSLALGEIDATPRAFAEASLIAGTIGPTSIWLIEDAPRSVDTVGPSRSDEQPAWAAAFPVWVAAQAGAKIMMHLSAGTALRDAHVGSIARLTDHINLSGTTPLLGLGESRLGPLFPDQTRLHDVELGTVATECARTLDMELVPAIAACTLGPALSTPAELRSYAAVGADVAVQRLSDPLVAAAHAGLVTIAFTAITDTIGESLEIARLVERASESAPRLDALALATLPALGPIAQKRREESEA